MDQGVHASNQSRNKYSTALIVFHSSLSLSLSPLEKITFLIGTLYWQPNLAIITHTYCHLLFFFFFHFFNKPTSPLQLKTNYTHTHTHTHTKRERERGRNLGCLKPRFKESIRLHSQVILLNRSCPN